MLVEDDSPDVARLFPPAFRDDPEAAAEFDSLVREGLVSGRVAALATLVQTGRRRSGSTTPSSRRGAGPSTTCASCSARSSALTEDMYERDVDRRDPRAPDLALYGWLSWLQTEIVEALSARL